LIGSTWFIGWVASLFVVPRIADNFGRKYVYMLGMVMTVLCYTGVLLATNVNWLIVLQLLGGFATGIRMSMGYVYMMEFLPQSHHTIVGTIHLNVEVLIAILAAIYF
jgi:MFS family permease